MKQLFLLAAICLLMLAFFFGCEEDATENTFTPGDNNDPGYLLFYDEFEGMDEMTGGMIGMTFEFIDSIMPGSNAIAKPSSTQDVILTYHVTSGYWYITADFVEDDVTYNIIDSIQFKEGLSVMVGLRGEWGWDFCFAATASVIVEPILGRAVKPRI